MRIVGGKLKGRNLVSFKGEDIRPTSDQARESLFNILQFKIYGKKFLDLFSGTGAVGIEAYSRGASEVTLNDLSKDSVLVIKKNLSNIGNPKEISVTNQNALTLLSNPPKLYDFIFIDPPYKSGLYNEVLSLCKNALAVDGIVILEAEDELEILDNDFNVYDKRKYGRARFTFLKRS